MVILNLVKLTIRINHHSYFTQHIYVKYTIGLEVFKELTIDDWTKSDKARSWFVIELEPTCPS